MTNFFNTKNNLGKKLVGWGLFCFLIQTSVSLELLGANPQGYVEKLQKRSERFLTDQVKHFKSNRIEKKSEALKYRAAEKRLRFEGKRFMFQSSIREELQMVALLKPQTINDFYLNPTIYSQYNFIASPQIFSSKCQYFTRSPFQGNHGLQHELQIAASVTQGAAVQSNKWFFNEDTKQGILSSLIEASLRIEMSKFLSQTPKWWSRLGAKTSLGALEKSAARKMLIHVGDPTGRKLHVPAGESVVAEQLSLPVLELARKSLGGVNTSTVGQSVASEVINLHSDEGQRSVESFFSSFLKARALNYFALLKSDQFALDDNLFSKVLSNVKVAGVTWTPEQRKYFVAVQMAVLLDWPLELKRISKAAVSFGEFRDNLRNTLENVAIAKIKSIWKTRHLACSMQDDFVELNSFLASEAIATLKDAGLAEKLKKVEKDSRWGVTLKSRLEAGTYVGSGLVLFGSGFLSLNTPRLKMANRVILGRIPVLPVLSGALAAISFTSQLLANERNWRINKDLLRLTAVQINAYKAISYFYGLMIPLSAAVSYLGANHLAKSTNALDYFLPPASSNGDARLMFLVDLSFGQSLYIKKWLEKRKNPIMQPVFWVEFISDYLKTLAMAQLFGENSETKFWGRMKAFVPFFITYETIGFVIDNWVQEVRRSFVGAKRNSRTIRFKVWWENTVSVGFKPLQKEVLLAMSRKLGPNVTKGELEFYKSVFSYVTTFFYQGIKSSTYLRFLENKDSSYLEVLGQFRFSDIMDPESIRSWYERQDFYSKLNGAREGLSSRYTEYFEVLREKLPVDKITFPIVRD